MAGPGERDSLFASNQAQTLRLIVYLTAAVALMVTDHHSGYMQRIRSGLSGLATPLYRIAQAPVELARWLHAAGSERVALKRENDELRANLLLAQARLNAARIETEQNQRLLQLLDAGRRYRLSGRLVQVFDIDIDPYRQRLLLDGGADIGIRPGQTLIDAWGLVGQVLTVSAGTATVMLITDPQHAVPVRNARTNQRAIAYGLGRGDRLLLPTLPINSDIQPGDELVTSGLGGRFPAGFPVAVVREVEPDANGMFAQAYAEPYAHLQHSSELLLLEEHADTGEAGNWPADGVGPPVHAPGEAAGEPDTPAERATRGGRMP